MYRLIAFFAFKNNLIHKEKELATLIKDINISFDKDGFITSDIIQFSKKDLESDDISMISSIVATYGKIRKILVEIQQKIGKQDGVLLEGRDIGSIIMVDADYKFFLEVDPKVAAKRRYEQHKNKDENISLEKVFKNILDRNELDKNRKIGPLIKSPDSIVIDTSNNSINEIAKKIVEVIENE